MQPPLLLVKNEISQCILLNIMDPIHTLQHLQSSVQIRNKPTMFSDMSRSERMACSEGIVTQAMIDAKEIPIFSCFGALDLEVKYTKIT